MTKKHVKRLILPLLCIVLLLLAVVIFNNAYSKYKAVETNTDTTYKIGVYNEKIAVFSQGDRIPIEVFDVYISTLPKKDQNDLKKGVIVKSKMELKRLIEDYTS